MSKIRLDGVGLTFPVRFAQRSKLVDKNLETDPRMRFDGPRKSRGFQVLRDLSFRLEEGDRVAIIGRNGSGKTTLLRTLHGVFVPQCGRLEVEGSTDALFDLTAGTNPSATGLQNIRMSALTRGYSDRELQEKLPEIVDFCDLGSFLDMPLNTYSAGMRMRMLFGVATAFDPEILLLDEWLSAGDAKFRKKAQIRMEELVERAGILVLASHSLGLLKRLCTKALWLDQGQVVDFGDLQDVFENFDAAIQKGDIPIPIKIAPIIGEPLSMN